MKFGPKEFILKIFFTLVIIFILEIVNTSLLSHMGRGGFNIPFNVLIILYFGFKIETQFLAVLILIFQYFHSLFTIEGWEMGTISGIVVCTIISYLKDLLHFTSTFFTIIVVQLFQVLWFVIVSALIYIKMGDFNYIINKFWRFLPEGIIASIIAPFLFFLLDKIWNSDRVSLMKERI